MCLCIVGLEGEGRGMGRADMMWWAGSGDWVIRERLVLHRYCNLNVVLLLRGEYG